MSKTQNLTLQEAVEAALDGRESQVRCPSHEDNSPSLSVKPGRTQPVLLHCHAGCDPEDIIGAGGLDWAQVCNPLDEVARVQEAGTWTPAGIASHVYPYTDEQGTVLFEVLRVPQEGGGKRFLQRRPDDSAPHGYRWNLDGVVRTLYKLPEVLAAVRDGRTIHVAEGEKCVDALATVIPEGEVSTCNSGGAGKWLPQYTESLAGANVIIYADADDPGRAHARRVRDELLAASCTVTIKEPRPGVLPSGKAVGDVADHIEGGWSLDLLLETTPQSEIERARTGIDILDLVLRPRGTFEWALDDTMAKGERLILIGFEGTGKSTLCRQIAVMAAAGIHPFFGTEMKSGPKKVLYIDSENHPDQTLDSWNELVGKVRYHGGDIERGNLTILEEWENERDLCDIAGRSWLLERVHAYEPDIVIMGPLTNLASKDLRDDEPVRRIKQAVNEARNVCNSAFIMEHHAPLKGSMDKERPMRPYGSSLFLKWPDYGFGIKPTDTEGVYDWFKNRGPRVRSRMWPERLQEGRPNSGDFPWVQAEPE